MAKKRMFSLGVLETDAFMDLPLSAQALYFHLCLRADDDGFIGNPKRITQNIGASVDDLKLLVAKRFVIVFEDGVIVIKHWRMHNAIKSDRYVRTNYTEDLARLQIKDNGAYTMDELPSGAQTEHKWITNGAQTAQTCSADKNSIVESSRVLGSTDVDPCRTDERQIVLSAWNENGISTVKKIVSGTNREKMLMARIREYGLETVLEAIKKIPQSPFLRGQNNRGWVITFDWFLKPNNFCKVLDGNFDGGRDGGAKKNGYLRHGEALSPAMQEAVNRMLERQDE